MITQFVRLKKNYRWTSRCMSVWILFIASWSACTKLWIVNFSVSVFCRSSSSNVWQATTPSRIVLCMSYTDWNTNVLDIQGKIIKKNNNSSLEKKNHLLKGLYLIFSNFDCKLHLCLCMPCDSREAFHVNNWYISRVFECSNNSWSFRRVLDTTETHLHIIKSHLVYTRARV